MSLQADICVTMTGWANLFVIIREEMKRKVKKQQVTDITSKAI